MRIMDLRPAIGTRRGFTLVEVVTAVFIVALVLGGMTVAYTQATRRAQWSGYSLAAQGLAIQALEQARAAVWDSSIGKNEITNLNLLGRTYSSGVLKGYTWANLDLPVSGTNWICATNYVTITAVYLNGATNPPVQLQMVTVDTVWPFQWGNTKRYFTNTISTYYAPDNRDVESL